MTLPHIILFRDTLCRGDHWHVFQATPGVESNDVISSFIIIEGHWQFFADAHYQSQMGPAHGVTLGPGIYNEITALGALEHLPS